MISFAEILVFLEEDVASGSSCFCLVFLAYVRACNDGERNREAEEGRGRRLFGGVRKRSREGRRADNDIAVSLCSVSQTSCEYWIGRNRHYSMDREKDSCLRRDFIYDERCGKKSLRLADRSTVRLQGST